MSRSAKDSRIAELEAAIAEKQPDIRVVPPVRDEAVHAILQQLWDETGGMWRFGHQEKSEACKVAICELTERLLGKDFRGFITLC